MNILLQLDLVCSVLIVLLRHTYRYERAEAVVLGMYANQWSASPHNPEHAPERIDQDRGSLPECQGIGYNVRAWLLQKFRTLHQLCKTQVDVHPWLLIFQTIPADPSAQRWIRQISNLVLQFILFCTVFRMSGRNVCQATLPLCRRLTKRCLMRT